MVTTQSFQTHCRGLHWDLFLWPDSKGWHSLSGCDQVMSVMWPPGGVRPSGALSWCGLSGAGASSPEPDTEPEPGSSGIWHQATDHCYWDGDGRGPLNKHTSSQIILRILLEYDMLVWSQEGGLMTDGFPLNQNTPVWCQCFVLEQIVIPSDF